MGGGGPDTLGLCLISNPSMTVRCPNSPTACSIQRQETEIKLRANGVRSGTKLSLCPEKQQMNANLAQFLPDMCNRKQFANAFAITTSYSSNLTMLCQSGADLRPERTKMQVDIELKWWPLTHPVRDDNVPSYLLNYQVGTCWLALIWLNMASR